MTITYTNCSPDEQLGSPAAFRAFYAKGGGLDSDERFQAAVQDVAANLDSMWGASTNVPSVIGGNGICVLDVVIAPQAAYATCASLAAQLDPGLAWLWDVFRVSRLVEIKRIDVSEAYDADSREADREAANADPNNNSIAAQVEHVAIVVTVLVVLGALAVAIGPRLLKEL